ncbi:MULTISPECIES: DUF3560 domain-containing protein [Cellulomonas]|uniref:DUF3560 domain-containing protein n=1 Tax=Cellulomonas denverensis TaxID=264297 RepID=A0A7X6KYD3_9CELL|nr:MULTISPECIES: DUF3560 domain-containing protein [Cellulomonas]NKY24403.1 DUF3560 domain-containing protein [Cellulomonas denverensis]QZN87738.1 DUF3560 domain-containing protein [Cellulomonas sp. C5510]GIG26490.1 hypothetical protein Cde04nite_27340 [Cellulomonas denverensis]
MSALTITHTRAEGTVLEGTAAGDGAAGILTACGWRWSRDRGTWYVPRSRDQHARHDLIEATRSQLQRAGHDVEVHVDEQPRDFADIEVDLLARRRARAAALKRRAVTAKARADAAAGAEEAAVRALPPAGEPIKIGHHSENRHRRSMDRAHRATGKRIAADDRARELERQAQAATQSVAARYAPRPVAARIDRLDAELRQKLRALARLEAGEPGTVDARTRSLLQEQIALLEQELEHWTATRAAQIADGLAVDYGPHNVRPGDQVQISGHWYRAVRANRATVTVDMAGGRRTATAPWRNVTDHNPANQQQEDA